MANVGPCGAQRKSVRGGPRRGRVFAYRSKEKARWQERAPWCARPIETTAKRAAPAAGASQ